LTSLVPNDSFSHDTRIRKYGVLFQRKHKDIIMKTTNRKISKAINSCCLLTIIYIFFMTTSSIAGEQKDLVEYSEAKTNQMSAKAKKREKNIKKNKANKQVKRIAINPGALRRNNSLVSFYLPDELQLVTFSPTKRYVTKGGSLVWKGSSESGQATFILNKGLVTGLFTVDGQDYKITPIDESKRIHIISQVDNSELPPEADMCPDEGDCDITPPPPPPPPGGGTPSFSTIRILVAYTPAAEAVAGGINQSIELFIDQANDTFATSGLGDVVSVELALAIETQYVEGDSYLGHLDALRNADGTMDELLPLREQLGADIVALVVDDDTACGLASGINVNADNSFFIISRPCTNFTFAHEIGHLLGARHNPEVDPSDTPYAYGHGYQAPNRAFRTVMSYNCVGGCPRIHHWSNPDIFVNGQPTGTNDLHDNVRVIEQRASVVANFEGEPTSLLAIPNLSVQWEYCYGLNFADWSSVAGATHYQLYQSYSTNSSNAYQVYSGTSNFKFLNVNSNQYFWVKACDSSGCGSFSNMAMARHFSTCF